MGAGVMMKDRNATAMPQEDQLTETHGGLRRWKHQPRSMHGLGMGPLGMGGQFDLHVGLLVSGAGAVHDMDSAACFQSLPPGGAALPSLSGWG